MDHSGRSGETGHTQFLKWCYAIIRNLQIYCCTHISLTNNSLTNHKLFLVNSADIKTSKDHCHRIKMLSIPQKGQNQRKVLRYMNHNQRKTLLLIKNVDPITSKTNTKMRVLVPSLQLSPFSRYCCYTYNAHH